MIRLVDNMSYLPKSRDFLDSNTILNNLVKEHIRRVCDEIESINYNDIEIEVTANGEVRRENKITYEFIISCGDSELKSQIEKLIYNQE